MKTHFLVMLRRNLRSFHRMRLFCLLLGVAAKVVAVVWPEVLI